MSQYSKFHHLIHSHQHLSILVFKTNGMRLIVIFQHSSRISINRPGKTQTSRRALSSVMSVAVIYIIYTKRPNNNLCSEKSQQSPTTREGTRVQEHNHQQLVSLTFVKLCNVNSSPRADCYCEYCDVVRETILPKWSELWHNVKWALQHDYMQHGWPLQTPLLTKLCSLLLPAYQWSPKCV